MEKYQERVVAEKAELDERIDKLFMFVKTEQFWRLPDKEGQRLRRQHAVMREYAGILGERIAAFK
jgi:hypothetical protein